jgi:hypothetical protein
MKNQQFLEIYPEIDLEFFEEASYYFLRLANLWEEDFLDGFDSEVYL